MITMKPELLVSGSKSKEMYEFMLNRDDAMHRKWRPGTGLSFHAVTKRPGYVGSVIYMDEFIGNRRLTMNAVVEKVDEGKEIVWRMKKHTKLPVRLRLGMTDVAGGTAIVHEITAGFAGIGAILDPLFRRCLTKEFVKAMDEHARAEFPMVTKVITEA